MNTTKKRGRKLKHHIAADGSTILNLRHRKDGRWEIIAGPQKGKIFTEPDEARAIQYFHKIIGQTDSRTTDAIERYISKTGWDATDPDDLAIYGPDGLEAQIAGAWFARQQGLKKSYYSAAMKWFASELIRRPQKVAEASGIEQLGYLNNIKPPETLPSLEEIISIFKSASTTKTAEKNRIVASWDDFCVTTGIGGISDITAQIAVAYRKQVHARGIAGKTQLHLFNRIRRILRVVKNEAVASEAITAALGHLTTLTASEVSTSLDPQPIERSDFEALLKAAKGDDRALLLICLNACLYFQEAVRLKWEHIRDGCLIGHREKKGKVVRVAVLWPETIEALAAIKRRGDHIFIAETGLPLTISGASKRYRKIRKEAGVSEETKGSHIRDGAATAAASAGVAEPVCRVFEGHRAPGVKDNYVKRNPEYVKCATDAVYKHYFG